jgi:D-sedoheptulose 7-phosphate isomerase
MTDQRIYELFHASIAAKMQAGEVLAPLIVEASEKLVQCLLNEGKILTCGNGPSAGLAQIFTNNLVYYFERERPSLPAITLGSDIVNVTAIANESSFNDVLAREVRAIGRPNDILIIISCSEKSSNILQAIQAAHERGIHIIALTGSKGGSISSLLDINDKELCAAVSSRARIHEIHLLTLFCLCDLIEEKLFGPIG